MRISWTLTGVGWAEVRVGDDRAEEKLLASYVSDAPQELLAAVRRIATGSAEARAQFEAEPTAYRWILARAGEDVGVRVLELADGDSADSAGVEVWSTRASVDRLVRAVVRCFDEVFSAYGEHGWESAWRSPFPRAELEGLRSAGRGRSAGGRPPDRVEHRPRSG